MERPEYRDWKPFHPMLGVFLAVGLSLTVPIGAAAQMRGAATLPDREPSISSLTSTSGRFLVVGPDRRENLDVADWVEEVANRLERMTGLKPPAEDRHAITIILRRGEPAAAGTIRLEQSFDTRQIRQSLTIQNLNQLEVEDILEELCRAIVDRRVMLRALETYDEKRLQFMARAGAASCGAPGWFSRGLAQDISPVCRARNGPRVLARLRAGRIEPIALFLDKWKWPDSTRGGMREPDAAGGVRDVEARAVSGELVGWILSLPEKTARIEKLLSRAAEGTGVPAVWVASNVLDGGTLGDLDEIWDREVLRQRRLVSRPGVVTAGDLRDLRFDLLLYAGDTAIPLSGEPFDRLEWKDIIRLKDAPWVPLFARGKAASLLVLNAGRGEKMDRVTDAYRELLDGLARGRSERKLNRWLAVAEERVKALEEEIRKEPGAEPGAGAAKDGTKGGIGRQE